MTKDLTESFLKECLMCPAFLIRFEKVPIDSILVIKEIIEKQANPHDTQKVKALAEDISKNGLKKPIVLLHLPNGEYKLIEGYHRYIACKSLGWKEIECRIQTEVKSTRKK